MPFFSVIITTYNRAALLKRALDSLLSQTETDWEAIIIDDGSTDDTELAVFPYLETGSNIQYIKQKNAGYSSSKNTGIFLSKGKFITFLDSDDEYSPTHLETRKAILVNHPEVRFLHGGVKVTGSQYVPDRFDFNKMVLLSDCVIGGTFFMKRDLAVDFNGFKQMPLGSDGDFFDRINNAGVTIMKTQAPTYIYHHETADSITNKLMLKCG
ncbi:MAG: glycosyltransferase family A protein [Bacteroidota bacterium]|nr:glycosyltransferase family A protein [Bacteroidota bacterium]